MSAQAIVIDARRSPDFDEEEGGRWVTVCARHHDFVQHETREDAREWAKDPVTWCEQCQDHAAVAAS